MTEIKIQNGCWQNKARQKMCSWKGTKNLITVPKLLQCRILKARKSDVNGLEAKAEVKTTAKYIQFDAWARPKGVMLNRSRVNGSKCKTAY